MRNAVNTLMVTGLATLFLAAPGFAGDEEKCKKGEECCKVTGKACNPKAEHKAAKEAAKEERNDSRDERKSKTERRMSKLTTFSFQQSGGFAGINKGYEVNLADLSEKDRSELGQMIEKSGLLKGASGEHLTTGAADMFVYSFSASDGTRNYSVSFDDGTLPQTYRPLLAFTKDKVVSLKRQ